MKRFAILIGLLLPVSTFALEYRNLSLLYTDAPFIPAEAAGISLLTSLHAVQGNPDGTFLPNRTINRAEFLKIALASNPKVRVSTSDGGNCFPDVKEDAWYSQYVCLAKKRGMVSGYPDGTFQPERSVNYAEALKILGELYEYIAYSVPEEEWYAGYVRAAQFHKTALPSSIKFDRPLTRGQMARLAAAFRAEEEGELETYRLAEKSLDLVISKEIADRVQTANQQKEKVAEEKKEAQIVQEKASQALHLFPAKSRFLLLGSSQILASGFFQPRGEAAVIRNVTAKFRTEVKNISKLYLVDEAGTRIAQLTPDTYDRNDLTWKAEGDAIERYVIPAQGKTLGIQAVLADQNSGFSEELIHMKWLSMNVSPAASTETSYQLIAANASYPPHQTAKATIAQVLNSRPSIVDMGEGENVLLSEFEITKGQLAGAVPKINHLTFTFVKKHGVILSDFLLGTLHNTETTPCSIERGIYVNCTNIPPNLGVMKGESVVFQLWGTLDISQGASDPVLQINLQTPGVLSTSISPGEMGHVRWSDGSGVFNWVDMDAPIAEGSLWK